MPGRPASEPWNRPGVRSEPISTPAAPGTPRGARRLPAAAPRDPRGPRKDGLRGRDLLSVADLTREELGRVLDRAVALKAEHALGRRHPDQPLAGRSVALLFEHPSLRTRVSFTVGVTQLGGHVIDLGPEEVGLGRRETVADVARNLDRFVDAIVVRTPSDAVVAELAEHAAVPVVNGLTDREHPCQALADILTIREHLGGLDGVVLAFVGDGNNVFHSLALAGALTGMEIRFSGPPNYQPDAGIVAAATTLADASGSRIVFEPDPRRAVRGADVIYTDAWTSMGQEAEADARREAFAAYRVDEELLGAARLDTIVMHCLPAHRGEEITSEVLDGPSSVVFEQAGNRLHAQKALLVELLADE